MIVRIDSYADLLEALSDLYDHCSKAKTGHESTRKGKPGNTDLEVLWLDAANAINGAIGECQGARDRFMQGVKCSRAEPSD